MVDCGYEVKNAQGEVLSDKEWDHKQPSNILFALFKWHFSSLLQPDVCSLSSFKTKTRSFLLDLTQKIDRLDLAPEIGVLDWLRSK